MQMQMQGKVAPRRIENLMAGPVVCTPRTRNYGPDQNAEGQLLLSPEASPRGTRHDAMGCSYIVQDTVVLHLIIGINWLLCL